METELLQFMVSGNNYVVPITFVKEIIDMGEVTAVPNSKVAVMGLTLVRGEIISVIDMNVILNSKKFDNMEEKMLLKCEHNDQSIAFCVDKVVGIRKAKDTDVESADAFSKSNVVKSNVKLGNKIYMWLDFEKIIESIM